MQQKNVVCLRGFQSVQTEDIREDSPSSESDLRCMIGILKHFRKKWQMQNMKWNTESI